MNRASDHSHLQPTADPGENLQDTEAGMTSHLLPFVDGPWALWRHVALRGAGFPFRDVLNLAAPECTPLTEELLQVERDIAKKVAEAWQELAQQKKNLTSKHHHKVVKLLQRLANEVVPIQLDAMPASLSTLQQLSDLTVRHGDLQQALHHTLEEALAHISQSLSVMAQDKRYREAILWQNRTALHRGIDALMHTASGPESRSSQRRRDEAFFAQYIQRYCTKNDSIGFFGPTGWGMFTDARADVRFRPGTSLLEDRQIYFEHWCIEAVAETLARDPNAAPWLKPRRLPIIRIEQNQLILPFSPPLPLLRQELRVLELSDGTHTAAAIAQTLLQEDDSLFRTVDEIYSTLRQLSIAKRISWSFELSLLTPYPERELRALLVGIPDARLRNSFLSRSEQFETQRAAIADAAGEPERLDRAFDELEHAFVQITNLPPTRSGGQTYAGRTLVYEDCRRDIELTLGSDLLHTLEPSLHLLLTSIRWFTQHIAARYRKTFLETYVALTRRLGKANVPLSEFWLDVQSMLVNKEEFVIAPVIQQYQEHWQSILQLPYNQHRVNYRSTDLREQVATRFQATAPGWKSACHHSPDLLIQAESVEEINKGNYQVILGEFHVAMNTLEAMTFRYTHPRPEELLQAIAADIPSPRVFPLYAKAVLPITRTRSSLITEKDVLFLFSADTYAPAGYRTLPISTLWVEFSQGRLVVCTADRVQRFDIIDFFAEFLAEIATSTFRLHRPTSHIPRVTIDRLVVLRESWTFSPGELPFASTETTFERFVGARRWAQAHSIPRFFFVKVPCEEKPYFVDLESPIYVDNFAKLVRLTARLPEGSRTIAISEMLPEPDKLWLTDNEGAHYTSELRCVLMDHSQPSSRGAQEQR